MEIPWMTYVGLSTQSSYIELDADLFKAGLMCWAVATGKTVHTRDLIPKHRTWMPSHAEELSKILSGFKAHMFLNASEGKNIAHYYAWPSGYAEVKIEEGEPPEIHWTGTKFLEGRTLQNWYEARTVYKKPERKPGNEVQALLRTQGHYMLHNITWVNAPFKAENYAPEVVKGFEFICKELNRKDPHGRITILDGPPGTGKTWFIRALIHHNKDCDFVIVPPDMISELGKPDLLPTFLLHTDEDKPLVLILEDADQMLAERMAESMTDITSALNMGDGILGEALNIRIIASTNQPLSRIDEAMQRPGRLSCRIEVGEIPLDQASKLYTDLGGHGDLGDALAAKMGEDEGLDFFTKKKVTLATVYDTAKTSQDEANS
jgi:hypothetical protein